MQRAFIYLIFQLLVNIVFAQSWSKVGSFPGTERDDGVAFKIDNKAYCGTGFKTGWVTTSDFYSFDLGTEKWEQIASMPNGAERQYACGFSGNGYGFVFGGINNNVLNDLWMYNPSKNYWTKKTPKPGAGLSGATCFVIGSKAFIIGGNNDSTKASNQVWMYDIALDTWQRKNDLPFAGSWRASATSLDGNGYLIFGKDSVGTYNRQLYKYTINTDEWSIVSSFPMFGRTYASMQAIANNLVVFAGHDSLNTFHNNLWYFNFSDSIWYKQNSLPSFGRKGGMCFSNYSTLYYTTGIDSTNTRLTETWKVDNPTFITKNSIEYHALVYPSPCSTTLHIRLLINSPSTIKLFNVLGSMLFYKKLEESAFNTTEIDVSMLSVGVYQILISDASREFSQKIVITR